MTSNSAPSRVSQIDLARDLGLTDRRIRGLVDEKIIPAADDDGLFELTHCRRRYRLFTEKPSPAELEDFFAEVIRETREAQDLVDKALCEDAVIKDVAAAGAAIQANNATLDFLVAISARTQAEREMHWNIHKTFAMQTLAGLFARVAELTGIRRLRTDDGEVIEIAASTTKRPVTSARSRKPPKRAAKSRRAR